MTLERSKELIKSLTEYNRENNNNRAILEHSSKISSSKDILGYDLKIDRESDTVKKLEKMGFKVIYPAKLTDSKVSEMNTQEKYLYEESLKYRVSSR